MERLRENVPRAGAPDGERAVETTKPLGTTKIAKNTKKDEFFVIFASFVVETLSWLFFGECNAS